MGSDFADFRAIFFELSFSIANLSRNGGHLLSESMVIEKGRATRYQGVCTTYSHKPRELLLIHLRRGNIHTRRTHELRTSRYTRAYEGMVINSGVDNTAAVDMHDSSMAEATAESCFPMLLPAARLEV